LLIACANAANLLLARASERRREFAIRASLGAGWFRLARQIAGESLALGAAAGAMGVALSAVFLRVLVAAFTNRLPVPQLDRVSVNPPALAVTAGLAILTALLSAIPACIAMARPDLAEALNASSRSASATRGANRTREAMIAVEVALSLMLLAASGLMLRTLERMMGVHLGFEPRQVLTARVAVPPGLRKAEQANHYTRILGEVRSLPGVQNAAITTILPFGSVVATVTFTAEGSDRDSPTTYLREISPGYFSTLGVRLLRGRDFNEGDRAGSARVAIVNDELARIWWPGEDPIGKRIAGRDEAKAGDWATVVGVVENIKHRSLKTGSDAELYLPYTQQLLGANFTSLVMRAQGDPLALATGLRKRIRQTDPDQPVTDVSTMQALVQDSAAEVRFHAGLLEVFAGIALGLAITGIFAVVSYNVTQRAKEIGIRSAMGASPRDVVRFVLAIAMRPAGLGACLGIAGGLAAARILQSELFETAPADPLVFTLAPLILITTAAAAAAIPAWRATRIDPAQVLRAE
jgi:predicted permease